VTPKSTMTAENPADASRVAAGGLSLATRPGDAAVTIRGLSKTFGPARVLRGVDLELIPGQVHALVGENGSGKSTLIKCLSGFHAPDAGSQIIVDGEDVTGSTSDCGFAFVHQDLGLVPGISVLENVALVQGFAASSGLRIRWRSERRRIARLLESYGIASDPMATVARLGAAERALLAILRAVERTRSRSRLLVLDEPTAALPEAGRERVLAIVRQMAEQGVAVLYVSHRLREVLALADTVTVLRDGARVGTFPGSGLSEADVAEHMMGRELASGPRRVATGSVAAPIALRVEGLCGVGVRDLSFRVRGGEIVSLTGLLGAGQNEIGKLVFGACRRTSGRVVVCRNQVRADDPAAAIRAGIAYIPADRVNESTLALMSVRENVTLPELGQYTRRGRLRHREERAYAAKLMGELDVRPREPERKMRQLSGGNQQKAIIGKWLGIRPKVLIVDEPTQGVDIRARAQIYRMIEQAADAGTAVIMVDSDLAEVVRLSDRVLVLSDGKVSGELAGAEVTRARISQLMNTHPSTSENAA
jgi:ribose transport system ATP-binding protein